MKIRGVRFSVLAALLILPFYSSCALEDGNEKDSSQVHEVIPQYTYDYVPHVPYDTIAKRLDSINSEIPLQFNDKVKSFIDYFTITNRDYTRRVLGRMDQYFPLFEEKLKEYKLPDELKYLSIVESGLNTQAISPAGAVGLWQFMYWTGRSFGLHKDSFVDDRMHPEKATEAACKYLRQLYMSTGEWALALAAYNAGPGNVRKAVRRSGYKDSFWDVYYYLPRETRSYVPQFIAIVYIAHYAEEHNLYPEHHDYPPLHKSITVNDFTNLVELSDQLGGCAKEFERLNPSLKWAAVPENYTGFDINIPLTHYDDFVANKEALLDSASKGKEKIEYLARNTPGSTYGREKLVYRVRSGDVLGTIASRYGVSISQLREWNNLRGNTIYIGQRLNVWVLPSSKYTSSNTSYNQPKGSPKPLPDGKVYYVQPGDTLWKIAREYEGVTIEKLKQLNKLNGSDIRPGQKLHLGT